MCPLGLRDLNQIGSFTLKTKEYEAAPNSVESEGRFRLSTILSHLSFGVHRNLVSEFGFQHPEVLVALDAPEVLLRLQEG